ncbi:MAG: hypothetical protein AAF519_06690 [Bacteroidota bacterium]
MVQLKSKKLQDSYFKFLAIKNMAIYVQTQAYTRYDDNFLNTIGFPFVGEIQKERKQFINDKMDTLIIAMNELIILGLIADFEKFVFDRVKNASGEISKIVSSEYKLDPFKKFSDSFVKTAEDIDKLTTIRSMVSTKLSHQLSTKFGQIIDYRNRLAHGKRFGRDPIMSLD